MAAGLLSFPVLAALSVVLLVVHILLQSSIATRELGRDWNAGPRDEDYKPKSALAGRARRASANFRETYPAFVVLILGLAIGGDVWHLGFIGTLVWFAARIVYIPLYLGGIAYVRSLVWVIGMVGLLMMAVAIVAAALGEVTMNMVSGLIGLVAPVLATASPVLASDLVNTPGAVAAIVSMSDAELKAKNITKIALGDVILPTGRIVATDPLVQPERKPFLVTVPPGRYPVTLFEHDGGIAGALMRFPGGPVFRWQLAVIDGQDIKTLKAGEIFGIPVDAGLASYMDASTYALMQKREAAAKAEMGGRYSNYYDDILASELSANGDDYVMHRPVADEPGNVAIFQAGWGDGFYAVYWGLDGEGRPVALLTDFQTYTAPTENKEGGQ